MFVVYGLDGHSIPALVETFTRELDALLYFLQMELKHPNLTWIMK